jgi:hypothetical protein
LHISEMLGFSMLIGHAGPIARERVDRRQLQGKSKKAKGRMKKLGWAGQQITSAFFLLPSAFYLPTRII